jgi:hypothetical protein
VAAKTVPNGACGYGELSAADNPGLNFAGVSLSKSLFAGKYALKGCGVCIEIVCADEVRAFLSLLANTFAADLEMSPGPARFLGLGRLCF